MVLALLLSAAYTGGASQRSPQANVIRSARPSMSCPAASAPKPEAINTGLHAAWTLVCKYGQRTRQAVFQGDPLRHALLRVHPQPRACNANFGFLVGVF